MSSALGNVALLVGMWVAIEGLFVWRTQLVGSRRIDLAEEVLALAYQATDVIQLMRSGYTSAGEGASRIAADTESEEVRRIRDLRYIPAERYNQHAEVFGRLQAVRSRYMVWFGTDDADALRVFRQQANLVMVAAAYLSDREVSSNTQMPESREMEILRSRSRYAQEAMRSHYELIVADGRAERMQPPVDDPVEAELNSALGRIEGHWRTIMNSEGSSDLLLFRLVSSILNHGLGAIAVGVSVAAIVIWLASRLAAS